MNARSALNNPISRRSYSESPTYPALTGSPRVTPALIKPDRSLCFSLTRPTYRRGLASYTKHDWSPGDSEVTVIRGPRERRSSLACAVAFCVAPGTGVFLGCSRWYPWMDRRPRKVLWDNNGRFHVVDFGSHSGLSEGVGGASAPESGQQVPRVRA